jgi:hypothetical protein
VGLSEPKPFVLLSGEWVGSWWIANWYKYPIHNWNSKSLTIDDDATLWSLEWGHN